jgi:hypothetical protein
VRPERSSSSWSAAAWRIDGAPAASSLTTTKRDLRPQKFREIDNRLAALAACQKGSDEVQHAPVVMARHIGVGSKHQNR